MDWAEQLQNEADFNGAREKSIASIDAFEETLKLRPDHSAAKTSLGTAYFFLGDFDEAISQYVQAINQDPNYPFAHFSLAFILFDQRDYHGAAKHFQAYLDREPNGPRSDFAKERLKAIKTLQDQDS